MKLLLVSSLLLLVSIASAEPTPYLKLLFLDRYHLAEGHDDSFQQISVDYYKQESYYNPKDLVKITSNSKTSRGFYDTLRLKSDLVERSKGFAIEAYPPGPEFDGGDRFCMKNSSYELRNLIDSCNNNIKLRMLTAEERELLEQYKKEQTESENPFEVIYDKQRIAIKFAVAHYVYAHFHYADFLRENNYHEVSCSVEPHKRRGDLHWIGFKHKLFDSSFVIDPTQCRREKCGVLGMEGLDLKMNHCGGEIRVRRK